MTGLGRILQEARTSRGVTLEEAENATRISRRYIEALEQEDFSVFPAPVYARGFLRSYSQFLGLDPADILALYPSSSPAQEMPAPVYRRGSTRLPQPSRAPAVLTLSVVILLVILGFVYVANSIGGGDSNNRLLMDEPTSTTTATVAGTRTPRPGTGTPTPTETRATRVPSGTVPELVGLSKADAEAELSDLGVPYVVIEVEDDATDPGLVFEQSPAAGTQIDAGTAVTLLAAVE